MEITVNQILGLPIFSLDRGEKIGQVKSFLLDTAAKELVALVIANKRLVKEDPILCLADVTGLSLEAITVDSPAVLRKRSDCPHLKELLKDPPAIAGLAILKRDGSSLGRADSFYIDGDSGKITKIEVASASFFAAFGRDRAFLPLEMIEIIGNDMILAKDDAVVASAPKGEPTRHGDGEAAGCGSRIMALSHRGPFFSSRRTTVFPEIPTAEAAKK